MATGFCPICEQDRAIRTVTRIEETVVKGIGVQAEAEFSMCSFCNEEFATADQMDRSLANAYSAYRKEVDLVSPEEIVGIRKKYNVSQKAFAKMLDLGDLTINGYEQGSLPSRSVSNLIRLAKDAKNFATLFEKNKHRLTPPQLRKIEGKLGRLNKTRDQVLYVIGKDLDGDLEVHESYSGYATPDWEKLVAMMQLILILSGRQLYKMALLKLVFYADFASFKYRTVSISGWPYARLPYGPVPDDFKAILAVAEGSGALASAPDDMQIGELYSLPTPFDPDQCLRGFATDEQNVIREVVEKLADKSATELSDLSHDEDAWIKTESTGRISYELARSLKAV